MDLAAVLISRISPDIVLSQVVGWSSLTRIYQYQAAHTHVVSSCFGRIQHWFGLTIVMKCYCSHSGLHVTFHSSTKLPLGFFKWKLGHPIYILHVAAVG